MSSNREMYSEQRAFHIYEQEAKIKAQDAEIERLTDRVHTLALQVERQTFKINKNRERIIEILHDIDV